MAPSIVFIVPYRSRESEKAQYISIMTPIIQQLNAEIYFAHQCDNRPFNRGAMRNIGFLAIKEKYPADYTNMTLVFNDVDTYPNQTGYIPNYATEKGTVKHFYGFTYTLGGIFSINASDFELVGGYPNFWAWGYEDNTLNYRCIQHQITIDRSDFVNVLNPQPNDDRIVNLKGTPLRELNYGEFQRYRKGQLNNEGLQDIRDLVYDIQQMQTSQNIFMVNISNFTVSTQPQKNIKCDLRRGNPFKKIPTMKMAFYR